MKHSQEIIDQIIELKSNGLPSRSIADLLNIGKSSVNNVWNRYLDLGEELDRTTDKKSEGPRILFFDLESSPSIVATFGRWKQNIGTESVLREGGFLLSACWKFLGDKEVTKIVLTPEEARNGDDSRIVCSLFEVFEDSDVVVAHNAVKFDYPLFKTRLISHGMPPPKVVKVTDTLQIAKTLRFNSNKLDSLGNYLNVGRKIETTGISLWIRCLEGDKNALQTMVDYNEQDVILLERVYMQLRAFDPRPANAAHYFNDNKCRCPACGSDQVEFTENSVYTQLSEFAEVLCNNCGHRSRTRKPINSKEKRSTLLQSTR